MRDHHPFCDCDECISAFKKNELKKNLSNKLAGLLLERVKLDKAINEVQRAYLKEI